MHAYAPLNDSQKKTSTFRVSSRVLTGLLLANAALICVFLFATSGTGNVGAATAARTRAFTPAFPAMRSPRMRMNAAITDFDSFKRDIESKYPDEFSMKADALYEDLSKQFSEKTAFVSSEEKKMEAAMLDVTTLENQQATVDRDIGTFVAPLLLAGLPVLTIVGLVSGAITTIQAQ
mmetsp:Transcript_447/g.473  ORF Transcript_447/g.473 Transcript_447/m.473 type:complete len:177 (-) Transcript_447:136-666(-)|eukprot:jgi/Bigna1/88432/estExt_fgenesh1_pg.C_320018